MSDTHVPDRQPRIPPRILQGIQGVDMIIHAGDLTAISVLDELEKIAPVHAVYGNMDSWEVKSSLNSVMTLSILGKTIVIMHGVDPHSATEEAARTRYPEADCVVFGHTHKSYCDYEGNSLIFNPGSACGMLWLRPSYGILVVREGERVEGEVIEV
jgi:putative phosphoesterase